MAADQSDIFTMARAMLVDKIPADATEHFSLHATAANQGKFVSFPAAEVFEFLAAQPGSPFVERLVFSLNVSDAILELAQRKQFLALGGPKSLVAALSAHAGAPKTTHQLCLFAATVSRCSDAHDALHEAGCVQALLALLARYSRTEHHVVSVTMVGALQLLTEARSGRRRDPALASLGTLRLWTRMLVSWQPPRGIDHGEVLAAMTKLLGRGVADPLEKHMAGDAYTAQLLETAQVLVFLSTDYGGCHVEFGRESIRALALLAHRCPSTRRADILYRGVAQLVCILLGQSPAPLARQQAAYLEQTMGSRDTLATLPRVAFALLRRLLCAAASQRDACDAVVGTGLAAPLICALAPPGDDAVIGDLAPVSSVSGAGVAAVGCEASELLAMVASRCGADSRLSLVLCGALDAACAGLAAEQDSLELRCARGQVTPLLIGLVRAVASLAGVPHRFMDAVVPPAPHTTDSDPTSSVAPFPDTSAPAWAVVAEAAAPAVAAVVATGEAASATAAAPAPALGRPPQPPLPCYAAPAPAADGAVAAPAPPKSASASPAPSKAWLDSAVHDDLTPASPATSRVTEVSFAVAVPHLLAVLSARNRAIGWHPAYDDLRAHAAASATAAAAAAPTSATPSPAAVVSTATPEAEAEAAAPPSPVPPPQLLESRVAAAAPPVLAGAAAAAPTAAVLDWDRLGELAVLALEALARRHACHRKAIRRQGGVAALARILEDAESRHATRAPFAAAARRSSALISVASPKAAAAAPSHAHHHHSHSSSSAAAATRGAAPHGPGCTCEDEEDYDDEEEDEGEGGEGEGDGEDDDYEEEDGAEEAGEEGAAGAGGPPQLETTAD